jgi:hypothetical protein
MLSSLAYEAPSQIADGMRTACSGGRRGVLKTVFCKHDKQRSLSVGVRTTRMRQPPNQAAFQRAILPEEIQCTPQDSHYMWTIARYLVHIVVCEALVTDDASIRRR